MQIRYQEDVFKLAELIRQQSSYTSETLAVVAFQYFHQVSKERVIDEDWLQAVLKDVGAF